MGDNSAQALPSMAWLAQTIGDELKKYHCDYAVDRWLCRDDASPVLVLRYTDPEMYGDPYDEAIERFKPDCDVGFSLETLREYYGAADHEECPPSLAGIIDLLPGKVADPELFGVEIPQGAKATLVYYCGSLIDQAERQPLLVLEDAPLSSASHVLLDLRVKMPSAGFRQGLLAGLMICPEALMRPDEHSFDTIEVYGEKRVFIILDLAQTRKNGWLNEQYL